MLKSKDNKSINIHIFSVYCLPYILVELNPYIASAKLDIGGKDLYQTRSIARRILRLYSYHKIVNKWHRDTVAIGSNLPTLGRGLRRALLYRQIW